MEQGVCDGALSTTWVVVVVVALQFVVDFLLVATFVAAVDVVVHVAVDVVVHVAVDVVVHVAVDVVVRVAVPEAYAPNYTRIVDAGVPACMSW